MTDILTLEDDRSRVSIVPEMGAGIATLEALTSDGVRPILRPWAGEKTDPFGLGSNLLVPFSNRISGGGFTYDRQFHAISPNLSGEPYPIHGDGFQKAWSIVEAAKNEASLILDPGSIGPFSYGATLRIHLISGSIIQTLTIVNRAKTKLPYGGGFHPWFPRYPKTQLQFEAESVWLENEQYLPTENVPISTKTNWDFARPAQLPSTWINNAFMGWNGRAYIAQPELGINVEIQSEPPLDTAILYSPGETADFFCFEPVSHAVDAHNRAGLPGLRLLGPGQALDLSMRLCWNDLTH